MNQEIMDYRLKGYCCSQIVTAMGLSAMGKENPDYIRAVAGLCFGFGREKTCGIVSASLCLLHLAKDKEEASRDGEDFMDWFEDAFGSLECHVLLDGNPMNKMEKCPMMMENAFLKLSELLDW